jgi:hypothetical protein
MPRTRARVLAETRDPSRKQSETVVSETLALRATSVMVTANALLLKSNQIGLAINTAIGLSFSLSIIGHYRFFTLKFRLFLKILKNRFERSSCEV